MKSRRTRTTRLKYWLTLTTVTALLGTAASAAAAAPQQAEAFDLDHDNVLRLIFEPFQAADRRDTPDGADVPLIADHALTVEIGWFDAIAPYHPTAIGIYSNLGRRPRSEDTIRNKNIAVMYAAYTGLEATFPESDREWRAMVEAAGLDPDNREENTTTPAGLGNLAARKVLEARRHDGSNRYGDEGGRTYNRRPYADYSGYEPVNTAYELRDPSRWQPDILPSAGGFAIQQFSAPFYGRVEPVSYRSPAEFSVAPPINSDVHNRAGYKRQADEVLQASAGLTDRQKMTTEFFYDKLSSLGETLGTAAVEGRHLDIEDSVHYFATVEMAVFDTTVATWYFKRKYDAVRPFSAIRYLYGDRKITAWGGPGKGTVDDITGREWRPYMQTSNHPEYPSASSALCLAYAQAAQRFFGDEKTDITVHRAKGSSQVEPGVTPATDITLHWDNWNTLARDCGMSRLWAGIHFRSAIENVSGFAPKIGDGTYAFVQRKLNGG
ncbi:vanadium-dependent haloperoxidase [Flindersiella endophytica]